MPVFPVRCPRCDRSRDVVAADHPGPLVCGVCTRSPPDRVAAGHRPHGRRSPNRDPRATVVLSTRGRSLARLTPEECRELARQLLAAADEGERRETAPVVPSVEVG